MLYHTIYCAILVRQRQAHERGRALVQGPAEEVLTHYARL